MRPRDPGIAGCWISSCDVVGLRLRGDQISHRRRAKVPAAESVTKTSSSTGSAMAVVTTLDAGGLAITSRRIGEVRDGPGAGGTQARSPIHTVGRNRSARALWTHSDGRRLSRAPRAVQAGCMAWSPEGSIKDCNAS